MKKVKSFTKLLMFAVVNPFYNGTVSSSVPKTPSIYELFADILSHALGTSYQYIYSINGGTYLPDGNWTGVIGLLNRSEADISVQEFFMTEKRNEAISYSYPISLEYTTFATRKPEYFPEAFAAFTPFSVYVWLVLAAIILLMIPAFYFLLTKKGSFSRVAMVVLATSLSQAVKIKPGPKTIGEHILVMCWLIGTTIIGMCYKSLLLSVLTLPSLMGVKDIKELATAVEKGQYNCMAMGGSPLSSLLSSSDVEAERIIGNNILENPYGKGTIEEFINLRKIHLAYVETKLELQFLSGRYFVSKDTFYPYLSGFIARKNFCCKEQLDMTIHRIVQSGLYKKLFKDDNFMTALRFIPPESPENEMEKAKLSLIEVESAFWTLIVGYIMAWIFLLVEVILCKLKTYNLSTMASEVSWCVYKYTKILLRCNRDASSEIKRRKP